MNYLNEQIKKRKKNKRCSAAVELMNLPYLSTTVPPFHTPVTFCLRTSCQTCYSLLPWCHQLSLGHLWLYGTLFIFSAEQESDVDSTSRKPTDLHHHLYSLPLFLIFICISTEGGTNVGTSPLPTHHFVWHFLEQSQFKYYLLHQTWNLPKNSKLDEENRHE